MEKQRILELKKHVATIHSTNTLSLLQRKIANALLFNAYEGLLTQDEHEIHIAALCRLIGYDSHDHKSIKKALVKLLATVIEWNLVDGNKLLQEGIWNASSIIADASIDGPICTYSYSNKMKQLLYRPELYGRLNMLVQAKFQSNYGLALYENCIRFQDISQTPWFDMSKFRKLMGVDDNKYKIFRDFKIRVIDKAVQEVNKYSPISISPQFRRKSRQVIAIQFLIKSSKEDYPANDLLAKKGTLSFCLENIFGLSTRQIEDALTSFEEEYIREKISIIETSASYQKGKIHNLAKYFLSALKNDYKKVKKRNFDDKIESQPLSKRSLTFDPVSLEEYRRFQNKEIIKIFEKQSKKRREVYLKGFESFLGKSIYYDIYLRDGLNNILVQDQLCNFLRTKQANLFKNIKSYEDFINTKN